MRKRGISPIVATVLLITLSLVLAGIIFAWATTFIGEQALKFEEPIENSCDLISFDADVYLDDLGDSKIDIVNRGNVPLYGVEVKKVGRGAIERTGIFDGRTIASGETHTLAIDVFLDSGDEVIVVPVILGDVEGDVKAYTCEELYGISTQVV